MSDSISIATETTQITNASRRGKKSSIFISRSRSKQSSSSAHWTVIVRDGFAALFDMIGDWAYFYAIMTRDEMNDGPTTDAYLFGYQIQYIWIIFTVLSFCILSTIFSLWTIFTSCYRNYGKNSLCCNCTIPRLCMVAILLEDIPQFVMTTWIDFTFMGGLTPLGVLNICSSLTALVNRFTTRYEEIEEENESNGENEMEMGSVYKKMDDVGSV